MGRAERENETQPVGWRDWLGALRIHQWAKNVLIFLPVGAGHHMGDPGQLAGMLAAFLAMGLCASGTYLWNDLFDREHDRSHPTKQRRLVASARVSSGTVWTASCALVLIAWAGGFALRPAFGCLLVGYTAVTLTYSLLLKRQAITDIFALALLYLSRIVAGVLISPALPTFWLFAFTFLLFLSLGAMKRYVELKRLAGTAGQGEIPGRGYRAEDLSVISELGIAAGVGSAVVLGFYSNSDQVVALYERPEWFWGICVVVLYWVARVWFHTKRGLMHDDPVVFALKDRLTWAVAVVCLACVWFASPVAAP